MAAAMLARLAPRRRAPVHRSPVENNMRHALPSFLRDETAVTSIEYALLAAFIALAIIASVMQLGSSVADLYERISLAVAAAA
jgi:pilus assembly protein Flp/PilA